MIRNITAILCCLLFSGIVCAQGLFEKTGAIVGPKIEGPKIDGPKIESSEEKKADADTRKPTEASGGPSEALKKWKKQEGEAIQSTPDATPNEL